MKYLKIFERFNYKLSFNNEDDLIIKLKEYSIPIEEWGQGQAKNVRSLLNEVIEKESILIEDKGYLVRYIEFVGIRIYYRDKNNEKFTLIEHEQIFKDGRKRKRNMPSSVSEKMKFGEDPSIAAIRGIEEELGIIINESQLIKRRTLDYDGGSMSYPGLKTKYKGHQYTCFLTKEQFNPDGYVEEQEDKSTFFKWIKNQ